MGLHFSHVTYMQSYKSALWSYQTLHLQVLIEDHLLWSLLRIALYSIIFLNPSVSLLLIHLKLYHINFRFKHNKFELTFNFSQ